MSSARAAAGNRVPPGSIRSLLCLPFAAVLALVSCTGGGEAERADNTLTIAITEEPDTLDPYQTDTAVTGMILRYAGDTLITKSPDGEYVPGLATDWTSEDDGRVWTFQLKEGVQFQDGDPVDAEAVKASLERATDPDVVAGVAGGLFSEIEEVEVVSPQEIRLQLERPSSVFLDNISDPRAAIVDAEAADELGEDFGRTPVLTGPWQIEEWRSADRIVLTRNADYAWGPPFVHSGPPHINRLVFRVMPEAAAQVAALRSGDVDMLTDVPTAQAGQFVDDTENYTSYDFLRKGVGLFLEFNVSEPPFDDPAVRRAFNHAINRGPLVDVALDGRGQPACGPLPPTIRGYWEGVCEYAPQYDQDQALELFGEAGWQQSGGRLTKDGEPFEFTLCNTDIQSWTQSAQLVQQQLEQLGITMRIQNFEFGTLLDRAKKGDCAAHFMGYTYTNPDILYLWFHSSQIGEGLNLSHYREPELDQMIEEFRRTTDRQGQNDLLQRIQKYVVDETLWAPLWNEQNYIVAQKDLQGAKVSGEGYLILMDARLG